MTQYDELIAKKKEELAAEAWGKQVKYIHASNGVMEVAYNNGLKEFEETALIVVQFPLILNSFTKLILTSSSSL